ncbi:hypothetical protein DH2020_016897 [Rehmannia glutinosa]|uniref:Uncharacterized protein n=1 Tax=Rehmannia glutinosa TaxID=99300 RepID=A0ABR0WPA0_REHGL
MGSKSLLLLGLLFGVILVISCDVVLARNQPGLTETKSDVSVDGWHGHHHHCHYPHCREKADHHEEEEEKEAETETVKSTEAHVDGHHKHKCKHWPHC